MRDYLHSRRPGSRTKHKTVARGRLTLKKLQESRAELTSIAISDDNIKSFQKYARKYNVTYALKKDKQTGKYYVFFKARDADSLHAAMSEFVAKKTLDKEKPTLKVRLAEKIKLADLLKRQKKVKHKRREVER
jgi:peroxiredoxin